MKLIHGDCLEGMKKMADKSVDLILCDLPYGTTACNWDTIIPLKWMWIELKRIIKLNGIIILFGSEPFSSMLRNSNLEMYKYDWIWEKTRATGFAHTKNAPQKKHEIISVFSSGDIKHKGQPNRMTYNPQGLIPYGKEVNGNKNCEADKNGHNFGRPSNKKYIQEFTNYPTSLLKIASEGSTVHPTQKPIELMKYLIRTYTNQNEAVLDFTMGSGTTGCACKELGRDFIGIEINKGYYDIAVNRINQTMESLF